MTGPTVGDEVRAALAAGTGVVALETSVIGQGLPFPRNAECIERMSGAIRAAGAVPAWIGAADGAVVVGVDEAQLARFAEPSAAVKVARRDLPMAVATGALGATTVSATIWAARAAGIAVGATGGIGGVHPGDGDVSADLLELARSPVLMVCSGPKSIIDAAATAEKLEELGVALVGYGVDRLPWFLAREAPGVELEHRVDGPAEAAVLARATADLGVEAAILLCNPIPAAAAMDADEVARISAEAEARAERDGVAGKALTPFLLAMLAELTGGRSLEANLSLLEDNARVAGEVAAAYAAVDHMRGSSG
ncbi:MAG: pseudouridine-5'-phosphate glycosidase [Actinomycetota bacterium]